jgi:hypothetical protein
MQAPWAMRAWDLPGAVRAARVVRRVRPEIIHDLHYVYWPALLVLGYMVALLLFSVASAKGVTLADAILWGLMYLFFLALFMPALNVAGVSGGGPGVGGGYHGGGGQGGGYYRGGGHWGGGWHGGNWHGGGWGRPGWGGGVWWGPPAGTWWGGWGPGWGTWWGPGWGWGWGTSVGVVADAPWGWDWPVWNAPVTVAAAPGMGGPQTFVEPQAPTGFWYYCTDPAGYFPYVRNCSKPWMTVVPPRGPNAPNPSAPAQ